MASSSSLSGRSVSPPPPPPHRGGEEIADDDDDHKKFAEEEKRGVALDDDDDDEDEDEEDEFECPTPPVSTKWVMPPEKELQFIRNLRGRPDLTWEELDELIEQENEEMFKRAEEKLENGEDSPPPPSIQSDDWDCFAHSKFGSGDVRFLNTCIINGLDLFTKDGCLVEAFSPFGEILDAKVVKKCKGLGFVTFASEDSVFKAIEAMNNTFLQGLQITLRKLQFLPGYSGPI